MEAIVTPETAVWSIVRRDSRFAIGISTLISSSGAATHLASRFSHIPAACQH
jgi:hypothetical protein